MMKKRDLQVLFATMLVFALGAAIALPGREPLLDAEASDAEGAAYQSMIAVPTGIPGSDASSDVDYYITTGADEYSYESEEIVYVK